jgi:c-di-GMP-binding flagellar brake protein YcgR
MKLYEIPVNTLVELQFYYFDERHMVSSALLYEYTDSVYISAVKSAGKTIPAKKFKHFSLIYKTDMAIYVFTNLKPRNVSYNGQNLYAITTEQEAQVVNHRNAYRLFIGAPVTAKIITENNTRLINCILKDISMTGMGIVSKVKIEDFAKIEITFRVHESSQEKLIASILHTREFRSGNGYMYGCEFDTPNETIGNYIARRQEFTKEEAE